MPGLLLSVSAMSGGLSKALVSAGLCFGGSWQQFSVPVPEAVGCVSLAAAGKQLLPSALPSLMQHIQTMAAASDWTCPISCKARSDLAYVIPRLHQVCFSCVIRWTSRKPDCSLYRGPVQSIKFSVRVKDYFLEYINMPAAEPSDASS
ncbi:hypothetical protein QYF61_023903 [Mycteria americana]|uniref:Uncharacterized protein n=1 Tax=Mycteria americana TaxID=33587 RepID=A0AAN7MZR0_MYCAM|nr:hypothetical protein QYF61_023903 [Mycteria americana]